MKNFKCPNCGKEIPEESTRCKYCDEQLPQVEELSSSAESEPAERNGFVTFYLGMGLVANSLLGVGYFITLFTRIGLWSAQDPMSSRIYGVISSVVLVIGYLMLLKWRKIGFYILAGMAAITLILNLIIGETVTPSTFSPVVGLMLLFVVLQIRKNGKSCWVQLY